MAKKKSTSSLISDLKRKTRKSYSSEETWKIDSIFSFSESCLRD